MLTAAAVCPHPPLLVPRIAQGAAPEVASLLAGCEKAAAALLGSGARELVVVGAGEATRTHPGDAGGDLGGYGAEVTVGVPPWVLPLSLTIGAWLLERVGGFPSRHVEVDAGLEPVRCRGLGAELAASADRVALLVMGDGSARRTERAPGGFDERACGHDTAVAEALAGADTEALAALDPAVSRELLAAGRPAWQVLAGAGEGGALGGELMAHEAPYGVGYFVAYWS